MRGGESPYETTSVVLLKEQVAALKEIQAARRRSNPAATLSHVIRDVINSGLDGYSHVENMPFTSSNVTQDAEVA